jgi:large subunit ribosomal protein L17
MFRNQLTSLFEHERITTTVAKAKELRPLAEKMVTLARTGTVHARRRVRVMVPDRAVLRRLFDEIAPRFVDRDGGYTRIVRIGQRRGDGAELAILELVDYEPSAGKESGRERGEGRQSLMDRARGMFGARPKPSEAGDEAAEPAEPAPEQEAAAASEVEAEAAEDTAAGSDGDAASAEHDTAETPSEASDEAADEPEDDKRRSEG